MREFASEFVRLIAWQASWITLVSIGAFVGLTYLLSGAAFGYMPERERESLAPLLRFPGAYTALLSVVVTFGGIVAAAYAGAYAGTGRDDRPGRAPPSLEGVWRGIVRRIAALSVVLLAGSGLIYGWGVLMALAAAMIAGLSVDGARDQTALREMPAQFIRMWWAIITLAVIAFAASAATGRRLAGLVLVSGLLFAEQLAQAFVPAELLLFAPHATAGALTRSQSTVELLSALAVSAVYLVGSVTLITRRLGQSNHPPG